MFQTKKLFSLIAWGSTRSEDRWNQTNNFVKVAKQKLRVNGFIGKRHHK